MVQESVLLGVDVVGEIVTLGLVLPICSDMDIQMDGDGYMSYLFNGPGNHCHCSLVIITSLLTSFGLHFCHH